MLESRKTFLTRLDVLAQRAAGRDLAERDHDVDEHDAVRRCYGRRLSPTVLSDLVLYGALRVEGDSHVRSLRKS